MRKVNMRSYPLRRRVLPVVQILLKTFFDILLFRRGPDALPHSWLLLHVTVLLWFLPIVAATVLIPDFGGNSAMIAVIGWGISLILYISVITIAGHGSRLLQTMTALIGCGALISIVQVVEIVVLSPLAGAVQFATLLILFWSIGVDTHILSRALDREWFVGLLIAMAAFVLQYAFTAAMTPAD